jgi:hypothetical protein
VGFAVNREIVAGNTLVAEAIQSQNFASGATGWAIFADGSYEFGPGGTFRGNLSVTGTDGSKVTVMAGSGAEIDLYPATMVGVTVDAPGKIKANTSPFAATDYGYVLINSPSIDTGGSPTGQAQLFIGGKTADGTPFPGFFTARDLLEFSGDGEFHGGIVVDDFIAVGPSGGTDIGRGVIGTVSSNASTTASGTEVVVLQATGFVWKAGRVYSVEMNGGVSSGTAGTVADFRLKKTVAGVISATTYGEYYRTPITVASQVFPGFGKIYLKNATGADITTDFALTLQSATNTVFASAAAGRPRVMIVRDEGLAADSWWTYTNQVS